MQEASREGEPRAIRWEKYVPRRERRMPYKKVKGGPM